MGERVSNKISYHRWKSRST